MNTDLSTPQDRAAFRSDLRKAAYDLPSPHAVTDLDTAIRLLEEALHLCRNGERAPGGNETWRDWTGKAETFLRGLLERTGPSAPVCPKCGSRACLEDAESLHR